MSADGGGRKVLCEESEIERLAHVAGYSGHTCLPLTDEKRFSLKELKEFMLLLDEIEKEMEKDSKEIEGPWGMAAHHYRTRIKEALGASRCLSVGWERYRPRWSTRRPGSPR